MDYSVLSWINRVFGESKFVAILARILSFIGGLWGMMIIVGLLLCFKKTRKIGCYVIIVGSLTWVLNDLVIKIIVKRNRPFIDYPELKNMCSLAGEILPISFSMPSGHSATAMAVAVAITFFSKKWGGVAIGLAVLVGLSRIVLCVHYPTDVLLGWAIGAIFAVGLHYATKYALKFIDSKWGNKNEKNSVSD